MMRINYRLDDLRALVALHETGSFVRGAVALHITQSAFSRRIAQLEAAIGVSLVERTTRHVALTPHGLELVREAGFLLRRLDESMEDAGRRARGESGRIVVACLTTVAYAVLPPVLRSFRKRYPDMSLQLRDDTGKRVTASVLHREAEFGISVLGGPLAELHAEHAADDPYVIAFPSKHRLARQTSVKWRELAPWKPMALRSTSANRQQIDETLAAHGIESPWFDEVEHLSSMLGLLRGGAAIGVLPRMAIGDSGLLTRPLVDPPIVRRIGLIRRKDTTLGKPAEVLWSLLADSLRRAVGSR